MMLIRYSLPICQKHKQEMSLTWMMLGVSLCFVICVGPITVWNVMDTSERNPNIGLSLYCIYWIQYTLNFFIYAFQSAQFRQAYKDFLGRFWNVLRLKEHFMVISVFNWSSDSSATKLTFFHFRQGFTCKTECMDPASMSHQTVMRIIIKIPQNHPRRDSKDSQSSSTSEATTPNCCSLCVLVQDNKDSVCFTI